MTFLPSCRAILENSRTRFTASPLARAVGVSYTELVFNQRHEMLAFAVVVLLLSFTALDVLGDVFAYPLCASDLEVELVSSDTVPTAPEAPHIDDCFCCSGCVESSTPFALIFVEGVETLLSAETPRARLRVPQRLFRPPKAS